MTAQKSKRAPSGAPTTKWFITAASVAAMLGGWVGFSSQPVNGVDPASQILANNLGLEPIPTIVPAPASRQNFNQNSSRTNNSSINSPASQPVLRSVTAPRPAPVTVTRSSK